MVSIEDVAARAGVSVSTVSRAFTRPQSVRTETRVRVLGIAQDLGYSPNRIARSLAGGRKGAIGVYVPDIANPFFPPLIKGVQAQARRQGYAVMLAESDEYAEDEFDILMAMASEVDGLVLGAPRMPDEQLRQVLGTVPTVLVNREHADAAGQLLSGPEGFAQAIEHLTALGHRRVGYIAGPDTAANTWRLTALRAGARRYDIELVELGPAQPRFESGVRATDSVLLSKVTAVVVYNDLMALGLLSQLHQRGIHVPTELSVIGSDDVWMAHTTVPPLTTVRLPSGEFGGLAVRTLVAAVDGAAERVEPLRVATELMVRGSTGAVPRHDGGR